MDFNMLVLPGPAMTGPPDRMTETPDLEERMDALSDVLRVANLTSAVFLHAEFSEPWCIAVQVGPNQCGPFLGAASKILPYHYIVEGELQVGLESGETFTLGRGEGILFPRNDLHFLGSDLRLPAASSESIIQAPQGTGLSTIRHGGGGRRTRMVCGFIGCESVHENPVVSALPAALRLHVEEGGASEWIRSTFQFAAEEVAAGRAGSETVLAKLAELLFVQAVRSHAETLPEGQTGWLAGLRDPFVARALALLHSEIARDWTVDDLGRAVGLSRSALAERFARLIGKAPMRYLAGWRMQVAASKLRNTNASLAQIADAIGYESEAAFSRAFKKTFGVAPAGWRRNGDGRDAL